jgi:Ca-activated chloride channel family protein
VWRPHPRRNPRALALTAAAAILVSGVIALVNATCLDLVVASSNEKFDLLSDIARTYHGTVDRKCVVVKIIKKASGAAESALRRDWVGEPTPKPHVWSPAATSWLLLLSQHRKDDHRDEIVPRVAQSLMRSPTVIAMPQQMASTLEQAIGKIGWEDIYTLASDPEGWARYGKPWGQLKLAKTNPTTSTSGLHALISVYNAAQRTGEPDKFLKGVEFSVVHYADSVATFLSNLQQADDRGGRDAAIEYVSAIAVEEKQVYDYNRGNPGSFICARTCKYAPPREKLVAVYPKDGTLVADHPYAVLEWTDSARREAADDFRTYLEKTTIQSRFQLEGFRDQRGLAGEVLKNSPYYDASQLKSLWEPPDSSDLVNLLQRWSHELRKPAHALFVIDVGRSMAAPIGGGNGTKLDLASRAAADALHDFSPRDVVGLWTFPTTDRSPYREAAPLTTLAGTTSAVVSSLQNGGGSSDEASFYSIVRASVEHVRASYASDRINAVVVLTGGGFELSDKAAARDLIAYLRGQREEQRVRVFTVAYGPTSEDVLRQIAESSDGSFYDATDPVNISELLRNALSNF